MEKNGERGGATRCEWKGGSEMFLLRKEGGCVWLRGNKVVYDTL